MDADKRHRLRAFAALAVGAALVALSLTGLSDVDGGLEAMARDADRVRAAELRPGTDRGTGGRCERDERPDVSRRRL